MRKFSKLDDHIFLPCIDIASLISILASRCSRIEEFQILNECHERKENV